MRTSLLQRIHNPRGRDCGCLPECWCRQTALGRALRWYLPKSHHTPIPPDWKRRKAEHHPS
jgi:hypothetical protein